MSKVLYNFFTGTGAFLIGYYVTNHIYIRTQIKKEGEIKIDNFTKLKWSKWFWYYMLVSGIAFIIIKALTKGWIS